MDKALENSLVISNAGLVNNPNVCIKNFGSTFVCVCEDCKEMYQERIKQYMEANPGVLD